MFSATLRCDMIVTGRSKATPEPTPSIEGEKELTVRNNHLWKNRSKKNDRKLNSINKTQ